MLGWLLSLFRRRPNRDPRAVFEFFDGAAVRRVDPVRVWSRMKTEDFDLAGCLGKIQAEPPAGMPEPLAERLAAEKLKAMETLAAAVTAAFGTPEFDGTAGLTVTERVSLAAAYLNYMALRGAVAHPTSASS